MNFVEYKMIDFGSFDYNGKNLILTEFPYINDQLCLKDRDVYQAIAKDRNGNRYKLMWKIIADHESELTDKCNWNECCILHL